MFPGSRSYSKQNSRSVMPLRIRSSLKNSPNDLVVMAHPILPHPVYCCNYNTTSTNFQGPIISFLLPGSGLPPCAAYPCETSVLISLAYRGRDRVTVCSRQGMPLSSQRRSSHRMRMRCVDTRFRQNRNPANRPLPLVHPRHPPRRESSLILLTDGRSYGIQRTRLCAECLV